MYDTEELIDTDYLTKALEELKLSSTVTEFMPYRIIQVVTSLESDERINIGVIAQLVDTPEFYIKTASSYSLMLITQMFGTNIHSIENGIDRLLYLTKKVKLLSELNNINLPETVQLTEIGLRAVPLYVKDMPTILNKLYETKVKFKPLLPS